MGFNTKQQEVIDTLDGPVMVVSCPGSGKTTVIVERTKALIDNGVNPDNILVITFTRASAEEMQARYIKKYGNCGVRFSTIHSVCLFMLKKAYQNERLHENLIKEGEQMQFVQQLLHDLMNRNDLNELTKQILSEISYIKNRNIDISDYESKNVEEPDIFRTVYREYEKYKTERGMFDMDDILIQCKKVLDTYPHILKFWQEKFRYLMIDEYQDTNTIQAEIFYAIAGDSANLCVVGDDDQAIYGFRAADSSIMLNFKKDYPECRQIFMDTNYRSFPEIIKYADNLIQHNNVRFEKKFEVGNHGGEGVVKFTETDTADTIKQIVSDMKQIQKENGNLSDYAILYRTNRQASLYISAFAKNEIPFSIADPSDDVHNSIIFYDILTYYKLAHGDGQYGDFAKVINKPSRYLVQKEFMKIKGLDRQAVMKVIDKHPDDWKRSRQRASVSLLISNIQKLESKTNPKDYFTWLEHALEYTVWLKEWCKYTGSVFSDQYEIFKYLKEEASHYDTMQEWFEDVEIMKRLIEEKKKKKNADDKENGVRLTTFHSSKGLEWKKVYIIDANEGITPSRNAEKEEEIEEERRLFYVAMTRAKEELHIYANEMKEVSRFVVECQKKPESKTS